MRVLVSQLIMRIDLTGSTSDRHDERSYNARQRPPSVAQVSRYRYHLVRAFFTLHSLVLA